MLEKFRKITNPLTIIAIFAGLAEVAGSAALVALPLEVQLIFVWFVMLFPTLLVGAFFYTLNRNSRVLYAPSDFKDEENYLRASESIGYLTDKNQLEIGTDNSSEAELKLYQLLALISRISAPGRESFTREEKEKLHSGIIELASADGMRDRREFREALEKVIDLYAAAGLNLEILELEQEFEEITTSVAGIALTLIQHFGRQALGDEDLDSAKEAMFDKYARAGDDLNLLEFSLPFRMVQAHLERDKAKLDRLKKRIDGLTDGEAEIMRKLIDQARSPEKLASNPTPRLRRLAERFSAFLSENPDVMRTARKHVEQYNEAAT